MSVILVNMPYSSLERPACGIGLLSAILQRDGIPCQTYHANLDFAEKIGVKTYSSSEVANPHQLLGEWLFAPLLSPSDPEKTVKYYELLCEQHHRRLNKLGLSLDSLEALRSQCCEFVEEAAEKVMSLNPAVVGCSSTFSQHVASLGLLKKIKQLAPEVVTMLGGGNCEDKMGRATHESFPFVDYVVSGEADTIMTPLARLALEMGGEAGVEDVPPGVLCPAHREVGYPPSDELYGRMIESAVLEKLPVPDYSEYFERLASLPGVKSHVAPLLMMETARGCWWGERKKCTFCGLNGMRKKFRSKRPETVLAQMDELHERHGIAQFEMTDSIMDMKYVDTLLPMLVERGAPYSIFYETKSSFKKNQVQTLKSAGITRIQPGIESLDDRVLKLMNKGCRKWHNIRLLKHCRQYGLFTGWNLLCGFPGEEDIWYRDMAQLFPLLHHLPCFTALAHIRYDRFSQYHDDPDSWGLELVPCESYSMVYDLPEDTLSDLAYFFDDRKRQAIRKNPMLKGLMTGVEQVGCRKALRKWFEVSIQETPPRLDYEDDGERLVITDTRECAVQKEYTLQSWERTVFLLLDDGISQKKLDHILQGKGLNKERATMILEDLRHNRLVLFSDGVWLSLVLEKPLPALLIRKDTNLDDTKIEFE